MTFALVVSDLLPVAHSLVPSQNRIAAAGSPAVGHRLIASMLKASAVATDTTTSTISGVAAHDEAKQNEEKIDWTRYWYPIMPMNYLDDDDDMETEAVPITILDVPLAIWRSKSSSGNDRHEYSVVADVCPHRRAPLSSGKILPQKNSEDKNDSITKTLACRYHGWQFNNEGSCIKIPMMDSPTLSKAFCAKAYPTQQRDGLLWVYMDPTDTSPPALPAPVMADDDNAIQQYSYSLNVFPVSYQSMIENSFDPSHAPFTHEALDPTKKSFFSYLSSNAIPMEKYDLAKDTEGNEIFSKGGFTVEHTPYMASDKKQQAQITTRKFIAPCTNVAQLPFFNTTLHFVPSKAGETLVYGGGITAGSPKMLQDHKILSKILPKKIIIVLEEFMHFYFTNLADFAYRFYNQDVQIMQGQDSRKMRSGQRWSDMYPSNSDKGVQFFQRWMTRFGGRPSFTMPAALANYDSMSSSVRIPSAWDRHAKYCPQCKRTIRRLTKVAQVSTKVSSGGMVAALASLCLSCLVKTRILSVSICFLALSLAAKSLAAKARGFQEKVFASPSQVPELQLMEIYSRTT